MWGSALAAGRKFRSFDRRRKISRRTFLQPTRTLPLSDAAPRTNNIVRPLAHLLLVVTKNPWDLVVCITKHITLLLPELLYGAIALCSYGGLREDLILGSSVNTMAFAKPALTTNMSRE